MIGIAHLVRHGTIAWLMLGAGALPAQALPAADAPANPVRYLSGPRTGDPEQIAMRHLRSVRAELELELSDIDAMHVHSRSRARHNGTTHLYLRQQIGGVDVIGSELTVAIARDGRVLRRGGRPLRGIDARARAAAPALSAEAAIRAAAAASGLPAPEALVRLTAPNGAARQQTYAGADLSREAIPAQLQYVVGEAGDLRLCWNIVIRTLDGRHWWDLHVDAISGAVLRRADWIQQDSYNIFPLPAGSPDDAPRSTVVDPADPSASPFGWHDSNGAAGAEFTDTRGNNARAQEDEDGNDSGGVRPQGGAGLVFDPDLQLQLHPSENRDAAITNLYYWVNIIHDVLYRYGFDEAAGNFQQNNYGNGGAGGDPIIADGLDGPILNNAQFATPPDGIEPRMEMFLWDSGAGTELQVQAPAAIAGAFPASPAAFGARTPGLTGTLVAALDAADSAGPATTDACSTLSNAAAVTGNIALVDRGTCLFVEKMATVQAAGGTGMVVANNQGNQLVTMAGQDPSLLLPAVFISQPDGQSIRDQLGNGVSVTLISPPLRDSSFDNGVIVHEYAHGLTNRLTGGAANASCLITDQARGMGEGWSDVLALMFTARSTGGPISGRPIGAYASSEPPDGPGIRNAPYARDLGISPRDLDDIASINQPHGIGEIWAAALWDAYWNFVDAYGFDADLYAGTGGNNLLMQIIVDGLKLQPCNPTFPAARDAMLAADLNNNAGANQCLLWEAFARRGIGEGATAASNGSASATASFDEPAFCMAQCGDGAIQPGEQCDDGGIDAFDGCASNCRMETSLPALIGTAAGGVVGASIAGVPIAVTTFAGQSGAAVAATLASAINASTALQALRVTAEVQEGTVAVSGEAGPIDIDDAGLTQREPPAVVPLAPGLAGLLLLFAVLLTGVTLRRLTGVPVP